MSNAPDGELDKVYAWLNTPARIKSVGVAIRLAIDWVIDGPRTGRYAVGQLETSEKIYIGNRVEHEILHQLDLIKQSPLDTFIEGIPIDIKFTLAASWMIPPEAFDHICILVRADETNSIFRFGLLRMQEAFRNAGRNRDGKVGVNSLGRAAVHWLGGDNQLPENFLLHLDETTRQEILALRTGQQRVTEVFRRMIGKPISTNALDTLAIQRDPSKRVRDARRILRAEGIGVFGSRYDNGTLVAMGQDPLPDDYWISLKLADQ